MEHEQSRETSRIERQPLVLGSASPHRQSVLSRRGIVYRVRTADIDEKAIRHPSARVMVEMIARAKAAAIIPTLDVPAFVVTSDEVVVFEGEIREKPVDEVQARRWITGYRGKSLTCVTALHVADTATWRTRSGVLTAEVEFSSSGFHPVSVDRTIEEGTALTVCGAYVRRDPTFANATVAILGEDHRGNRLLEGDAEDVIQGLPYRMLYGFLAELGWKPE